MIDAQAQESGSLLLVISDGEAARAAFGDTLEPTRLLDVFFELLDKTHTGLQLPDGQWVLVEHEDVAPPGSLLLARAWEVSPELVTYLLASGRALAPRAMPSLGRDRAEIDSAAMALAESADCGAAPMAMDAAHGVVSSFLSWDRSRDALLDAFAAAFLPASRPGRLYGAAAHLLALAVWRGDARYHESALRVGREADIADGQPGPLAFAVGSGEDEDDCAEVFARDEAHARRRGAAAIGADPNQVVVRREPSWDQYAGRRVPAEAWWRAGYGMACDHCQRGLLLVDDAEADPTFHVSFAFCDDACFASWRAKRDAGRVAAKAAARDARSNLLAAHPGVTIVKAYAEEKPLGSGTYVGRVDFTFPWTRHGPCTFRADDTSGTCVPRGDVAAWIAYAGLHEDPEHPRRCRHGADVWVCEAPCEGCSHPCRDHYPGGGCAHRGGCSCRIGVATVVELS